jgi:hypothetical protein
MNTGRLDTSISRWRPTGRGKRHRSPQALRPALPFKKPSFRPRQSPPTCRLLDFTAVCGRNRTTRHLFSCSVRKHDQCVYCSHERLLYCKRGRIELRKNHLGFLRVSSRNFCSAISSNPVITGVLVSKSSSRMALVFCLGIHFVRFLSGYL